MSIGASPPSADVPLGRGPSCLLQHNCSTQIHAAAYLSGTEVTQLKINSSNWAEPPSEGPSTAGSGGRPFTLVDPPHLPVDDDGLRASDEEHISKLEDFLAQVLCGELQTMGLMGFCS